MSSKTEDPKRVSVKEIRDFFSYQYFDNDVSRGIGRMVGAWLEGEMDRGELVQRINFFGRQVQSRCEDGTASLFNAPIEK